VRPGPLQTARARLRIDAENLPDEQAGPADQELLAAERHTALREAFSRCLDKLRRDPAISALINGPRSRPPPTRLLSRRPVTTMRA